MVYPKLPELKEKSSSAPNEYRDFEGQTKRQMEMKRNPEIDRERDPLRPLKETDPVRRTEEGRQRERPRDINYNFLLSKVVLEKALPCPPKMEVRADAYSSHTAHRPL